MTILTTATLTTLTTFCCNLAVSCADTNVCVTKLQIRSIITYYAMNLGVYDIITNNYSDINWDAVYEAYIDAANCNNYYSSNECNSAIAAQLHQECIVLFPHCTICNITTTSLFVLHRGDRNFYDYVTHTHTQIHMWYDEYMKNTNYMVAM